MTRFKMVATDINSNPIQHRTWVVNNQPDYSAQQYFGLKSGKNAFENIFAITVDDSVHIADFNLPIVTAQSKIAAWESTQKSLPFEASDSQLLILEDYAYLFGGNGSNKILKCQINNPTDWFDTGSVLPVNLSGSQLAYIGDWIYLFGGASDNVAVDNIYRANAADPLSWEDCGSLLPFNVKNASLAIIGDYIYLFGGHDSSKALKSILRAPISNPLSWEDTTYQLEIPLFNSQIGIIGDLVYLFGGQSSNDIPVRNIMGAYLSLPTSWFQVGTLPYSMFGGQFFIVGSKAYIIGSYEKPNSLPKFKSLSKIIRCNVTSPATWRDTGRFIPTNLFQFQLGIIYDRIFLFGGNGLKTIYMNNYNIKYDFSNPEAIAYGERTRTDLEDANTISEKFKTLGFPYWRTNYVGSRF